MPYRGNRFWTHQIPTSCLPTLLIFIHIEHTFCICLFLVTIFSATISCWEKCDEKCAYMFNVYKNQLSRQTGSRNSYRYPISREGFLNPSDSYFLFADLVGFYSHWTYMHICRHILSKNPSHDMGYLYEACDQISDFCHQ
jgi:hypothetical protein